MTRGKWVALAVLGLCVVNLGLVMAFLGLRARGTVPADFQVEEVQDRYGAQLDRLRALVRAFPRTGYGDVAQFAQDRELFSAQEILQAEVQTGERTFWGVAQKEPGIGKWWGSLTRWRSRSSTSTSRSYGKATPRAGEPSISASVVTEIDGRVCAYSVVEYEELVSMGDGTHRLISITLYVGQGSRFEADRSSD